MSSIHDRSKRMKKKRISKLAILDVGRLAIIHEGVYNCLCQNSIISFHGVCVLCAYVPSPRMKKNMEHSGADLFHESDF